MPEPYYYEDYLEDLEDEYEGLERIEKIERRPSAFDESPVKRDGRKRTGRNLARKLKEFPTHEPRETDG